MGCVKQGTFPVPHCLRLGHHVARKPQSSSIKNYKRTAPSLSHIYVGNVVWSIFFGWWIALLFILAAALLAVTVVGLALPLLFIKG